MKGEEIPESVWEDTAGGADLAHAYALYLIEEQSKGDRAETVNRENELRSASVQNGGSTEPSFTREEVEKMSPKDVSKNYKHILRSMRSWKY